MRAKPSRILGTSFLIRVLQNRNLYEKYYRTAIGLKVKDGIVLAVEKLIHSKLLMPEANRRIQTVDRHIGLVRLAALSSVNRLNTVER